MTAELWNRVEYLLAESERLPPDRRAAFLEASCRNEPAARSEVLDLLAELDRESTFLTSPLVDPSPTSDPPHTDRRIGPYRLIRVLGSGGMGVVYLARRDDGVHAGYVALKVVRRSLSADPGVLASFERERRLLGTLSHPYVARLLDGGSTPEGEPYLVMEYVEGEPLTAHCHRQRLALEERLRLFGRVCEAVSYAHRNLVLHQDLKPSNILITHDGTPRLVDFGVARLLDERGRRGELTGMHSPAFTPDYAAPEMRTAGPVSTAADVFSLGVILHELLLGTRPAGPPNAPRPSTVASHAHRQPLSDVEADSVGAAAASMCLSLDALARRLRGDLDVILHRALHPEPDHRYPSVELLAGDVDRHLRALPISARADTLGYRTHRFVRRHRWGVASASALLALSIALVAIMLVQNQRVRAHAGEVVRERDRAEETTRFLVDLFGAANPARTRGETFTAADLLARGAEHLETDLARQPSTRGALHLALAEAFEALGEFETAATQAAAAMAAFDGEDADTAVALETARSLFGWIHHQLGRSDEAREYLAEAVMRRRQLLGPEHPALARSLNDLGVVEQALGDLAGAADHLREAYAIRLAVHGAGHESVGVTSNNLAALFWQRGMLDSALVWQHRTVETLAAVRDPRDPQLAIARNNLGALYMTRGNYALADSLYRQVLATRLAVLGDDHPDVANTLSTIATLRIELGDLAAADSAARRALSIRQSKLGDDHPDVARSHLQLAQLALRGGDPDVAALHARTARTTFASAYGERHHWTAMAVFRLGETAHFTGTLDEARSLYESSGLFISETLGADHPHLVRVWLRMGDLALDAGDPLAALPHYRRALELATNKLAARHPDAAAAHLGLANSLRAIGAPREDFDTHLQEALEIREATLGPAHDLTMEIALRVSSQ